MAVGQSTGARDRMVDEASIMADQKKTDIESVLKRAYPSCEGKNREIERLMIRIAAREVCRKKASAAA